MQITPFTRPNCTEQMTDLGIAIDSIVKTAQIHNVDNRFMYKARMAAVEFGLLGKECTIAYGNPVFGVGEEYLLWPGICEINRMNTIHTRWMWLFPESYTLFLMKSCLAVSRFRQAQPAIL